MRTCKSCGWEVRLDFGMWSDIEGGVVCRWVNGMEFAHDARVEELVHSSLAE